MVTLHKMLNSEYCETAEFQFSGLSTDTKPSTWHGFPVGVNSLFFEEDTGDFYYLATQGETSQTTLFNGSINEWSYDSARQTYSMIAGTLEEAPDVDTLYISYNGSTVELTGSEVDYGTMYANEDYGVAVFIGDVDGNVEELAGTISVVIYSTSEISGNIKVYYYEVIQEPEWVKVGEAPTSGSALPQPAPIGGDPNDIGNNPNAQEQP